MAAFSCRTDPMRFATETIMRIYLSKSLLSHIQNSNRFLLRLIRPSAYTSTSWLLSLFFNSVNLRRVRVFLMRDHLLRSVLFMRGYLLIFITRKLFLSFIYSVWENFRLAFSIWVFGVRSGL